MFKINKFFSRDLFYGLISIAIMTQSSAFMYYVLSKHGMVGGSLFSSIYQKLYIAPEYDLIRSLNLNTDKGSLVLSMKPADMYYARGRMISYLDERLLPFYAETDTKAAARELVRLGVTHVHVPDYGLPPLYNSRLYAIVRDPQFSTLVSQKTAGQIYSLKPESLASSAAIDISPEVRPWMFRTRVFLAGRKGFAKIEISANPLLGSGYSGGLPFGLFQRNWASGMTTGLDRLQELPDPGHALKIQPSRQYALDMSLEGDGFVALIVDQFSGGEDGEPIKHLGWMQVSSFEMSKKQPRREYSFRFLTDPSASIFKFTIESVGSSRVQVNDLRYRALE